MSKKEINRLETDLVINNLCLNFVYTELARLIRERHELDLIHYLHTGKFLY